MRNYTIMTNDGGKYLVKDLCASMGIGCKLDRYGVDGEIYFSVYCTRENVQEIEARMKRANKKCSHY